MGLDKNGVAFLASLRDQVVFKNTATLGRQTMYVTERELASTVGSRAREILAAGNGFCEPFLTWLGAETVVSVDASAYEGAEVIHDLNEPIGAESNLANRFSAVIDGGTLEHVFDVSVALRSAARMVALDGHYLAIAPVSGLSGHGFYQFSPEFFFRALSTSWGFRIERVLLTRAGGRRWYEVADPEALGRRVDFSTLTPAYLYVCARRVRLQSDLSAPQQSDYSQEWAGAGRHGPAGHPILRRLLPVRSRELARRVLRLRPRRLDREAFRPADLRRPLP